MKSVLLLAFLGLFVGAVATPAAQIDFASGDNSNEFNSVGLSVGTNVTINVHPAWQPNNPNGGKWISYGDTGSPGSVQVPNVDPNWFPIFPTAIFYEIIDLTGVFSIESADLHVWADDTAAVYIHHEFSLDLLTIQEPNSDQGAHCVDGPIGCTPANGLHLSNLADYLAPGRHNFLLFGVYQRDGGPFGLMYEGSVISRDTNEPHATPEPATLGLLGSALTGLALWSRKRRAASSVK
jgi:hypothetical protein